MVHTRQSKRQGSSPNHIHHSTWQLQVWGCTGPSPRTTDPAALPLARNQVGLVRGPETASPWAGILGLKSDILN